MTPARYVEQHNAIDTPEGERAKERERDRGRMRASEQSLATMCGINYGPQFCQRCILHVATHNLHF